MSRSRRDPRLPANNGTRENRQRRGFPRDMSYDDPTQRRIAVPSMLQSRRAMSLQGRPRPAPSPPQPVVYRGPYVPFANRGPYVAGDRERPTGPYWQSLRNYDSDASHSSESLNQAPKVARVYIPFANRGPYFNEETAPRGLQSPDLSTDSLISLPTLPRVSPIPGQFSDPDLQATIRGGPPVRQGVRSRNPSIGTQLASDWPSTANYHTSSTGAMVGSSPHPVATAEAATQSELEDPNERFQDPPIVRNLLSRSGRFTERYGSPPPGDDDPIRPYLRPRSRSFTAFATYSYPDFREYAANVERQDVFGLQTFASDLPGYYDDEEYNSSDEDEDDYDENGSIIVEASFIADIPVFLHRNTPITPMPSPSQLSVYDTPLVEPPRRLSHPDWIAGMLHSRNTSGSTTTACENYCASSAITSEAVGLGITYATYISRGTSAVNLIVDEAGTVDQCENYDERLRRPGIRHRVKHLSARITGRIARMKKYE